MTNRRGFLVTITGLFCGGLLRKADREGSTPSPSTSHVKLLWHVGNGWSPTSCACGFTVPSPDHVVFRCPVCGKSPYYTELKRQRRA